MNNLRSTIDALFRKTSPDWLLLQQSSLKQQYYSAQSAWESNEISQEVMGSLQGYSHDDIGNVWQKVKEDWAHDDENETSSVFALVNRFSKEVLRIEKQEPIVDYSHFLRWRELSHLLGEDLFTTNYLAWQDLESGHQRTFFSWRPVLATNNIRLRNLLDKGVAENHFHLQGSAPHCDISWLALMNKVTNRKNQFKEFLGNGKLVNEVNSHGNLYLWVMKAAYIRLLLFHLLMSNNKMEDDFFAPSKQISLLFEGETSDKYMASQLNNLQERINSFRLLYGKAIDQNTKVNRPDYCILKNMEESNFQGNGLLCGERWLLYQCARQLKLRDKEFSKYQDLFYTYLVIKNKFREEVIQLNDRVGFKNFSLYQDRKMVFLNDRNIYRSAIFKMAIQSSFQNQNILSFEARVKPESSKNELKSNIARYDKACLEKNQLQADKYLEKRNGKNEESAPFFYVEHFIKKPDKTKLKTEIQKTIAQSKCRHAKVRKEIKLQAIAIAQLRSGLSKESPRISGIDAAASELDTRPEVYAQAYRYLKDYNDNGRYDRISERTIAPIRSTFHAGEDFYDLVDGLRTIDESIKFLNLGEGDRLGHALALGIEAKEYYKMKEHCIMLPKQWHLDNISWLISRIDKYNLSQYSSFSNHLRWEFQILYNEIYESFENSSHNSKDFVNTAMTTDLYYEAWKLRGDDPFLYDLEGNCKMDKHITFWNCSGINNLYPSNGLKRKSRKVNLLYYNYHFNSDVKSKGNEIKRFEISKEYIKVVTEIQKQFQLEIAKKHLGIETNPSSNYLIGTFKRYDKHPLVNFFNLGLELNPEKINECPQLFVSINTDDQGVFNTYLENEYALMALALEKMEDEDGKKIYKPAMIYDWLDRIRQMGLEMSFKQ